MTPCPGRPWRIGPLAARLPVEAGAARASGNRLSPMPFERERLLDLAGWRHSWPGCENEPLRPSRQGVSRVCLLLLLCLSLIGPPVSGLNDLVSPRAGIIYKPIAALSLYGTYSVSYLPRSGDQFSSLTTITRQVEPEKFDNYEVGVKWDASDRLSLTTSAYRLDRTNMRSTDPNDPTR